MSPGVQRSARVVGVVQGNVTSTTTMGARVVSGVVAGYVCVCVGKQGAGKGTRWGNRHGKALQRLAHLSSIQLAKSGSHGAMGNGYQSSQPKRISP